MKFEMTTNEFNSFCTHLAIGVSATEQVSKLEAELASVRLDLEHSDESRRDAWARNDRLEQETHALRDSLDAARREASACRSEILKLQDQLFPFRKERKLSEVFHQFITGQKLDVIKALRELYDPIGLREAKDCVEGVAPKPDTLTPEKHREISELALVFQQYHTASPDVQRERLRPFVSVESSANIASILNGNFRAEDVTPAVPQIDTTTGAGVGSEAGDGLQE